MLRVLRLRVTFRACQLSPLQKGKPRPTERNDVLGCGKAGATHHTFHFRKQGRDIWTELTYRLAGAGTPNLAFERDKLPRSLRGRLSPSGTSSDDTLWGLVTANSLPLVFPQCEKCNLHFRHKSQLRLHLRQKHGAITNTKVQYRVSATDLPPELPKAC